MSSSRKWRFTLSVSMALIAALAMIMASEIIKKRRYFFIERAASYKARLDRWPSIGISGFKDSHTGEQHFRVRWTCPETHKQVEMLYEKYLRASRYPWLGVEIDPAPLPSEWGDLEIIP